MKYSKKMNKLNFFLFSICFSIIVLVGATYSWQTYSDTRINRVEANDYKLVVNLQGNLAPMILAPNQQVKTTISVRNDSKEPVFVRLSLKEVLLMYEIDMIDQTGNANLNDYANTTPVPTASILLEQPRTWEANRYFRDDKKNRIYKAVKKVEYNYKEDALSRDTTDLRYLSLNFTNLDPITPNPSMYWIYYKGYFYYSERLYPTNSSSVLLDNVQLKEEAPNGIKGSFYAEQLTADAVLATEKVFTAWDIPMVSGNPVYDLLIEHLE